MNWYLKVLKDYATFNGRARRTEFWMYVLFNLIISVVLGFVGNLILSFNFLLAIYSLAVLVPSLAVSARRLHDTGRSGFLLFLLLLPIIGGIILIVFCVQDSQEGDNKYGSNPKAQTA